MHFCAVTYKGLLEIHFCECQIKLFQQFYQNPLNIVHAAGIQAGEYCNCQPLLAQIGLAINLQVGMLVGFLIPCWKVILLLTNRSIMAWEHSVQNNKMYNFLSLSPSGSTISRKEISDGSQNVAKWHQIQLSLCVIVGPSHRDSNIIYFLFHHPNLEDNVLQTIWRVKIQL